MALNIILSEDHKRRGVRMIEGYKQLDMNKKIAITGAAGFIGFHLSKRLLDKGINIIGFDNINDYYDINLKYARMDILNRYSNFTFIKGDLTDKGSIENVFKNKHPDIFVNLAAQAGVRYSLENPYAYINSNILGFLNILEMCRSYPVEHLIYASSSSVYGANNDVPFSVSHKTDSPVSLYAATKKSNELMAYTYSHLYGISSTGLRFFTVYGPYGRPDMAYFSFTENILANKPITVYNNGDMYRDFTYVDDIVLCIEKILCNPPKKDEKGVRHKVYNIGNNKPEKLIDFIDVLENCLGKKAKINFLPMQPGDVYQTYADVTDLINDFNFSPNTPITQGLKRFTDWYISFYNVIHSGDVQ